MVNWRSCTRFLRAEASTGYECNMNGGDAPWPVNCKQLTIAGSEE